MKQKSPRKQLAKHNSKYRGSEKLNLQLQTLFLSTSLRWKLLKFGHVIEADGNKWK